MLNIARFQLGRYFRSPVAWSLAAVLVFIMAWIFLVQVERFIQLQPQLGSLEQPPGLTDIIVAPLLQSAAMFILLVLPLLSMRLVSDEYRSGSMALLLSSPLPLHRLVLGKYLALLALLGFLLVLIALMPFSLLLGGDLDIGRLLAGLLGLGLQLAAYGAIGLLMSTLSREPVVAAIATYGLLLLLSTIDLAPAMQGAGSLFSYLAINPHLSAFLAGRIALSDITYYLLIIVGSLALALYRLEARRCDG